MTRAEKDRSTVEISRALHRQLRKLAVLSDRRLRDVTDEAVMLGLKAMRTRPKSDPADPA